MSTRLGPAPAPSEVPPAASPPAARMLLALLALVGLFVSLYLSLYKAGVLGIIECRDSGCETVQASAYAWFPPRTLTDFGVPVAYLGLLYYGALLAVALLGLQPRWAERREVGLALVGFGVAGVAFSAWLTYLEAAVIHAWCQWCVVSAVLAVLIFLLSLAGLRRRT